MLSLRSPASHVCTLLNRDVIILLRLSWLAAFQLARVGTLAPPAAAASSAPAALSAPAFSFAGLGTAPATSSAIATSSAATPTSAAAVVPAASQPAASAPASTQLAVRAFVVIMVRLGWVANLRE